MTIIRGLIAIILVCAVLFGLTGEPLRAIILVGAALLLFLADRVHLRRFLAARERKAATRRVFEKGSGAPLP